MGDTYCPLCGVPVGPLAAWSWDNPEDIDQDYDPELLPDNRAPELQWIEDWRIIGENLESENVCKVWVSGPARFSWGPFPFERGEDVENLPESHEIAVYKCERGEPFAVPFHVSCREVFCRYLGITIPELDKHAFFEGLKSLAEDICEGTRLDIDYGTVDGNMEQDWVQIRDEEYFVFNPAEDKQLNEYVNNLPMLTPEKRDSMKSPAGFNTTGDPFAKFPPSVLLNILAELRQPNAVFQLRIASPCFSNLQLGSVFWRQQIKTDMPWIWELPEAGDAEGFNKDWKSVYQTISRAILPPFESKLKFRGLSNRVRIWDEIIPQIASAHWEAEELVKALNAIVPEILRGASGFRGKRLGKSGRGENSETIQTLLDTLKDLELATPALLFDWSDEGSLVSIRVVKDGQWDDAPGRAQSPSPAKTDKVIIPGHSWLTGLVFTSRGSDERPLHETRQIVGVQVNFTGNDSVLLGSQEGDKRLVRVDENKLVVGLKSLCSEDNTFHQFSLVQRPLIEPSGHAAVEGSLGPPDQGNIFQYIQGHRAIVEQFRERFNSDAEPYLWYRELPPPALRLSPFYGLDQNQDIVPIKHFVFASTEEEMADITSISVDINLRGFQVDYGSQPSKSFGPGLHTLETLTVDGKGGERIDRVTVSPRRDDKVPLIRIDTNRNRTLIVGDATERTTLIELMDGDLRLRPCGFTASWSGTAGEPWLRTIGIMGSAATGYVDVA